MKKSFRWLSPFAITAIHREQLSEHGGSEGVRDEGLLESALARPQNLAAYEKPSPFACAAAYAFGIIKNHPFVDGNKRTGFLAAYVFLDLNGWSLTATEIEVVEIILALASGKKTEKAFALWLEEHTEKAKKGAK